jgi:ABC-type uncharacterized transport system ATPase subunit
MTTRIYIKKGEIHACGENGQDKTTLMRVLYVYQQMKKLLLMAPRPIASPNDAIRHGIGWFHNISPGATLTVLENIILGDRQAYF